MALNIYVFYILYFTVALRGGNTYVRVSVKMSRYLNPTVTITF